MFYSILLLFNYCFSADHRFSVYSKTSTTISIFRFSRWMSYMLQLKSLSLQQLARIVRMVYPV